MVKYRAHFVHSAVETATASPTGLVGNALGSRSSHEQPLRKHPWNQVVMLLLLHYTVGLPLVRQVRLHPHVCNLSDKSVEIEL